MNKQFVETVTLALETYDTMVEKIKTLTVEKENATYLLNKQAEKTKKFEQVCLDSIFDKDYRFKNYDLATLLNDDWYLSLEKQTLKDLGYSEQQITEIITRYYNKYNSEVKE